MFVNYKKYITLMQGIIIIKDVGEGKGYIVRLMVGWIVRWMIMWKD